MNAKTSHNILIHFKGKKSNFIAENFTDTTLSIQSKLKPPVMGQIDTICLLIQITEKNTTSPLW